MRKILSILTLSGALFQASCAGVSSIPGNPDAPPPPPPNVTVAVSPNPAFVRSGNAQSFTAAVTGTSNTSVTWQVNGVTGGSAATD